MIEPIEKVMKRLSSKYKLDSFENGLEVFGREGHWHTVYVAKHVKNLEVWEINRDFLDNLRRNLPNAKIKIVDSFREVKMNVGKFDLVSIDNPEGVYGENGEYCEHFELFPFIFRLVGGSCVIILNVNLKPYNMNPEWRKRRKEFYKTEYPGKLYTFSVAGSYRKLCEDNGFNMKWWFIERRNDFIVYLVFKVELIHKI